MNKIKAQIKGGEAGNSRHKVLGIRVVIQPYKKYYLRVREWDLQHKTLQP